MFHAITLYCVVFEYLRFCRKEVEIEKLPVFSDLLKNVRVKGVGLLPVPQKPVGVVSQTRRNEDLGLVKSDPGVQHQCHLNTLTQINGYQDQTATTSCVHACLRYMLHTYM